MKPNFNSMDRLSNYYRSLLLFLVIAFFSAGAVNAQDCEIQLAAGQQTKGCLPFLLEATVVNKNSSKTIQTISWDFGDATSANTASVSHFYNGRGTFCASAKIKYTDGTECTASLPNGTCIQVFGKPKANMVLPSGGLTVQCYQSPSGLNKFCFSHTSTRSADGKAITRVIWNFGDGDTSSSPTVCHTYDSSGQYNITLEVFDEEGCSDRQEMKASIIVLPDIKANFTMNGKPGCEKSLYTFVNKTDTNGFRARRWYWDFGDGSAIDSVNWSPTHEYVKDGSFTVTLTFINELGCKAQITNTATNYVLKLEVFYQDTICWSDAKAGHTFRAKELPGATYWEWNFGDPKSGPLNFAPFSWNASHKFVDGPKNYQVTFTALHSVCGKFDTCIVLHVKGPMAVITQPDPVGPGTATNNYVAAKRMPLSEFAAVNAGICAVTTINYSTFSKLPTPKRMVEYKYCNSTVNSKSFGSAAYCDGDQQSFVTAVDLQPIDSVVTFIDSVENKLVWSKGQPIPSRPYYPSSGRLNTRNMHDSNLSTCTVPDLVRFTNHSLKYRLYNALDDNTTRYVNWDTPEPDYPKNSIIENGYKDTCVNPGWPFASDSMQYLWKFNDGTPCTSTIANKDWECQYSTLIAPYHYYSSTTPPESRCMAVELEVTDPKMNCSDKATLMLKQGPPTAWWDRNAFCKMTWEMQFMTNPGVPGQPDRPLRGFRMAWQKNCTGFGEFFGINFEETLPNCPSADNWWVTFDSAASTKVLCPATQNKPRVLDHGFAAPTANAKGYAVAGPKSFWSGMPWLGRYWYMDDDEGCKTIGVVVQNGECFDTAWYKDYICFNRLTAEFNIHKENLNIKYDQTTGKPIDTLYSYTFMDSSQSVNSQNSKKIYCHALGANTKPGFDIALVPNDRKMPVITEFKFQMIRQEFPSGDTYYYRNNPGSIIKGYWPDTAALNPYNIQRRKTDKSPLDPANSFQIDSISSIYDTLFLPLDTGELFYYTYDANNNISGTANLNVPLYGEEVAALNNNGQLLLRSDDFRVRRTPGYLKCPPQPTMVYTKIRPMIFRDTVYLLKLVDTFFDVATQKFVPRLDNQTFLMDKNTGKPTADSIRLKDTVKFRLPFPGFYTISSESRNLDGCYKSTLYHLIYGHFARFNIVGGDSIICVGDTIRLEHLVRYWTTNCPPPPGARPPAGCIDGQIANFQAVLTPWDVADPQSLREQLDGGWKKPNNFRKEEMYINWGDGSIPQKITGGTVPTHRYTKPGIFDITMTTTDSNGCTINTIRRNFIKVIGLDAKFEVSPKVDSVTYCRKDVVLKDLTELIGGELNERGKFGYKDRVVKRNPFTGQYYLDSMRFGLDSIIAWRWDPGNGTIPFTLTGSDTVIIPYLRYGTYTPGLRVYTVNNTPRQCTDELYRPNYLRLVGPRPDFSVGDTAGCAPFTIDIKVHNDSGDKYEWVLEGSGETFSSVKGQDVVKFTSNKPGKWRLFVRQTETHFDPVAGVDRTCFDEWPTKDDTIQFWITVYPYGPLDVLGDTVVCLNKDVTFRTQSERGEYEQYDFTFQGGTPPTTSGLDSTGITRWTTPGKYWVSVKGTTEHDCVEYDSMQVRVEDVQAEIGVDSSRADAGIFTFINNSKEGVRYIWNFGDNTPEVETLLLQPIPHEYAAFEGNVEEGDNGDSKRFPVTLKTISKIGCEAVDTVWVEIPRKWKRYNVLTPNGDGANDVFNPKMGGELEYELSIFNRWGEKVFESKDSDVDWNGKVNNDGADCPEGTYFYVWKFKLIGGFERTMNGTVTLLR